MKNSKFKIQKIVLAILILTVFSTFYSCNKVEENLLSESTKTNKTNSASSARKGSETDSLEYYANLISPSGAVTDYIKKGGILPVTKFFKDFRSLMNTRNIGNGSFPYACANNLLILGYPGAVCPGGGSGSRTSNNNNLSGLDCPSYILDPYGNKIYAIAMYDNLDDRQGYYVYLPDNFNANSPIVVLIHGGAWFSGPNPDNTNGWQQHFSDNPSQKNLVKDLLTANYVVVVPLYRLVKYGNNSPEILSNTITMQSQINDIDAAILHVRTNFSCLGINANSIQVLGESAGGQLALMWAYTKITISSSYIKSVISCYAPTNLRTYGDYLQSKTSGIYSCDGIYQYIPIGIPHPTCSIELPFFPFYFPVNITNSNETRNTNTLSCIPHSSFCLSTGPSGNVTQNSFRILESYNFIQSATATVSTTPLTNNEYAIKSPRFALSSSRIIPTYIMHSDGGSDRLVPYNKATDGMSTALSTTSNGGLIATLNNNSTIFNYNFTTETNKHLIQLFPGANHTWGNTTSGTKDNIRANIVFWFNGHK